MVFKVIAVKSKPVEDVGTSRFDRAAFIQGEFVKLNNGSVPKIVVVDENSPVDSSQRDEVGLCGKFVDQFSGLYESVTNTSPIVRALVMFGAENLYRFHNLSIRRPESWCHSHDVDFCEDNSGWLSEAVTRSFPHILLLYVSARFFGASKFQDWTLGTIDSLRCILAYTALGLLDDDSLDASKKALSIVGVLGTVKECLDIGFNLHRWSIAREVKENILTESPGLREMPNRRRPHYEVMEFEMDSESDGREPVSKAEEYDLDSHSGAVVKAAQYSEYKALLKVFIYTLYGGFGALGLITKPLLEEQQGTNSSDIVNLASTTSSPDIGNWTNSTSPSEAPSITLTVFWWISCVGLGLRSLLAVYDLVNTIRYCCNRPPKLDIESLPEVKEGNRMDNLFKAVYLKYADWDILIHNYQKALEEEGSPLELPNVIEDFPGTIKKIAEKIYDISKKSHQDKTYLQRVFEQKGIEQLVSLFNVDIKVEKREGGEDFRTIDLDGLEVKVKRVINGDYHLGDPQKNAVKYGQQLVQKWNLIARQDKDSLSAFEVEYKREALMRLRCLIPTIDSDERYQHESIQGGFDEKEVLSELNKYRHGAIPAPLDSPVGFGESLAYKWNEITDLDEELRTEPQKQFLKETRRLLEWMVPGVMDDSSFSETGSNEQKILKVKAVSRAVYRFISG